MVIFDTDRCFERDKVRFDLLSIKEMDEYGWLFCNFLKRNFKAIGQTFLISINRIEKKFRIAINDEFLDGFDPKDLSAYENGNVKPAEAFFHALNYYFSNVKNHLEFGTIPEKLDYDGIDSMIVSSPRGEQFKEFIDSYSEFCRKVEQTEASQKLFLKDTM